MYVFIPILSCSCEAITHLYPYEYEDINIATVELESRPTPHGTCAPVGARALSVCRNKLMGQKTTRNKMKNKKLNVQQ